MIDYREGVLSTNSSPTMKLIKVMGIRRRFYTLTFMMKCIMGIVAGMNIFVAFFVLLLLLADITPPAASSIPLIGKKELETHTFCISDEQEL